MSKVCGRTTKSAGKFAFFLFFVILNVRLEAGNIYTVFFNLIGDDFYLPAIGLLNKVDGDFYSLELGVFNFVENNMIGSQIGIINSVGEKNTGFQFGAANFSNDMAGVQIGLFNVVAKRRDFRITKDGNTSGGQFGIFNMTNKFFGNQTGGVNVALEDFLGLQFGLVNWAQEGEGGQIGLINFSADSKDIFPLGLLNLVKYGGYYALQAGSSDYRAVDFSLKAGVPKSYTSLFLSAVSKTGVDSIAIGLGWGNISPINEWLFFNIELNTFLPLSVFSGGEFAFNFRITPQLGINFGESSWISLVLGPVIALNYSSAKDNFLYIPLLPISDTMSLAIGYQAGLRIRFFDT